MMFPRQHRLAWPVLSILILAIPIDAFDCAFQASSIDYDLKPLGGLRTSSKENPTPPTTSEGKVFMDLCGENGIPKEDDVADEDQVGPRTIRFLSPTMVHPAD